MEGKSPFFRGLLPAAWCLAAMLPAGCTANTLAPSADISRSYESRAASYEENSDSDVRERVQRALLADDSIALRKLEVSVWDGQVTLEGTVVSRDESRRAMELVRGVSGVRGITNKLHVTPTATAAP